MKDKKQESKGIIRKILLLMTLMIIILGIFFILYIVKDTKLRKAEMEDIFSKTSDIQAELTEYIVYGTHLNIKGKIDDELEDVENVKLVFASLEKAEDIIKLNYEIDNGINFYTSELINTGIDLESLPVNKYYLLIEVSFNKKKTKYYSLQNKTEYDEVLYYTITKNNSNNKISIGFNTYESEEKNIPYMEIDVKHSKLPKDVYDIVIDPGHGGSDTGAEYAGYAEADLNLEYGKMVKKQLEELGLKVKITRDGTEDEETFGTQTVYDKDGRVNIVGLSKAKYVFSIHLNSITEANSESGVEIYIPYKTDITFAKLFADNIVKYANTSYSTLDTSYKVEKGIYARTFREWEIEESIEEAVEKGFKPYAVTTDTPYLYMIRETGGIATRAYVDGRNKQYGANMFVDSNIGVEAFLLELGYLNNDENLQKLVNEKEGYVEGIVQSVKEWLKI